MADADPFQMHEDKLKADALIKVNDRLDTVRTEIAKATILLNSGAIVATLGFMQALAGKGVGSAFLTSGIAACACFAVGSIAAVYSFFARHDSIWWHKAGQIKLAAKAAGRTERRLNASVFLFGGGVLLVLWGANAALREPAPSAPLIAPGTGSAPVAHVAASSASK